MANENTYLKTESQNTQSNLNNDWREGCIANTCVSLQRQREIAIEYYLKQEQEQTQ